jgi:hypothetical protein
LDVNLAVPATLKYLPLLKNEWVKMGDPAPPHRRTHGRTGAGVLALVKPLPPKAVAGRPGFTRAKRPRLRSPPADRWAAVQEHALAPSLLPRATSPIRNSIEPNISTIADRGAAWVDRVGARRESRFACR